MTAVAAAWKNPLRAIREARILRRRRKTWLFLCVRNDYDGCRRRVEKPFAGHPRGPHFAAAPQNLAFSLCEERL